MSKTRVTPSDVQWWIKNSPDSPHTQTMIRRLERQQETAALRRKQLMDTIPQWYEKPSTYYSISQKAWGEHPGPGYGSGAARRMLNALVTRGEVEAVQADGWNNGVLAYRYVNDGQTPAPPPPPPSKPEDDHVGLVKVGAILEHFRYGLATDDPDEKQWHLAQIAKKLRMERYLEGLDYKPGTPPAGKDDAMADLPEGLTPIQDGDDVWFSVGDRVTINEEHEVYPEEDGTVEAVGRGTGFYAGEIVYDVMIDCAAEHSERFVQGEISEAQ